MVNFLNNIVSGEWSDDDLIKAFRSLSKLWGIVLGTPVCLGIEDGEICIESHGRSVRIGSNRGNKPSDGERLEAYIVVEELEKLLAKLTKKQREAIFWRLIDTSRENNKAASNDELARMLGISRTSFLERLYSGWEKLGGDSRILQEFIAYESLKGC
jgi:hypothetical protein